MLTVSRTYRAMTVVSLLTLTSACTMGPDYKRPVVVAPDAHRGAAAADPTSLADLQWFELFRDAMGLLLPKTSRISFWKT